MLFTNYNRLTNLSIGIDITMVRPTATAVILTKLRRNCSFHQVLGIKNLNYKVLCTKETLYKFILRRKDSQWLAITTRVCKVRRILIVIITIQWHWMMKEKWTQRDSLFTLVRGSHRKNWRKKFSRRRFIREWMYLRERRS